MDTGESWPHRSEQANLQWQKAAQELKSVLELAAQEQHLVTYSEVVAKITAFPLDPRSAELARLLCERIAEDAELDHPLLSSIVIGRRTNRPGKGFFQFARRYFHFEDDEAFWLSEVASIHDFYRRRRSYGRKRSTPAPHRIRAQVIPRQDSLSETDFIMSFFD